MSTEIKVKSPKFMAAILMLGAFIGLFGETALNMALTNIMEQFSIEASTAQWLTTGYLLTLAILVPISALLMKWFSTRQLVTFGLVVSMLGAVLAAIWSEFCNLNDRPCRSSNRNRCYYASYDKCSIDYFPDS